VVDGEAMREIIAGDSTVSFNFNQDEKREIYLSLQKMYYTSYPDNISSKCEHQIVPSHKVELIIRANEVIKHISYEDGCRDETMQSRELRHLVNLIYEISNRHKAVRQLPETMLIDL
jgi:bisphosphoglycerate-independent phosphoglycerate mutase (AlkP superfamily)